MCIWKRLVFIGHAAFCQVNYVQIGAQWQKKIICQLSNFNSYNVVLSVLSLFVCVLFLYLEVNIGQKAAADLQHSQQPYIQLPSCPSRVHPSTESPDHWGSQDDDRWDLPWSCHSGLYRSSGRSVKWGHDQAWNGGIAGALWWNVSFSSYPLNTI